MNELSKAAAALGAIGGKSTSAAKQAASRENGRKHVAKDRKCHYCGKWVPVNDPCCLTDPANQ